MIKLATSGAVFVFECASQKQKADIA